MSLLEVKNTVECQCCGNRDESMIVKREDGYVCKCCGVWYKKSLTDKELREQMQCEKGYSQLIEYNFSDAHDTFEHTLLEYPNSINALWGILLARFGVVYIKGFYGGVVEPIYCFPNHEKMKNRYVQNEPEYGRIMDLLKNEDALRFDYEKKAEAIDNALNDFKEYKKSTEYDVFICVKINVPITDPPVLTGRTRDYGFALKMYSDLTRRGVNVFFSYITKYDEKIWRNLVKSKKMLLICSSEEYLESPRIKSEWKRWLHLNREEELYVFALPSDGKASVDILPKELAGLERQIYTQNDQEKLIEDICKGVLPETQRKEEARKDGKIVYKDGHEEVLEYGITEIKEYVYKRNKDIVSVVLPNSVISINGGGFDGAFAHCSSLESITIPDSVAEIGDRAFLGCIRLAIINIPESVIEIGDSAFEACHSLTSITIPDSVKLIGHGAFFDCSNLISINISNSVKMIGSSAFYRCYSLSSIAIPNSVKMIGDSAFENCSSLASINIPNSVTTIGNRAFENCSGLATITGCESVTMIGDSAFENCSSLASINIPNSVTTIGNRAFENCSSLATITGCESVTTIGNSAFEGCYSLSSITIPDSVTEIGNNPFKGCKLQLKISPANKRFKVIDNNLYSIDGKRIILCIPEENETVFSIPYGVTEIGWAAFYGCSSLTSITIPNSVTEIGGYAFSGCSSLASITIPNSVTKIDERAFYGCNSLKNVYFDGTKTQWKKLEIDGYNYCIADARIHFKGLFGHIKGLFSHTTPKKR